MGTVIAVWVIEVGLFGLVVAALLAERPLALGATVAAIAILVVVARTSARLWGRGAALGGAIVLAPSL